MPRKKVKAKTAKMVKQVKQTAQANPGTMAAIMESTKALLTAMNELPYNEYRYHDDDTKGAYDLLHETLERFVMVTKK